MICCPETDSRCVVQVVSSGLRPAQLLAADCRIHRQAVALPAAASFLKIGGRVLATSVREVGDQLEVRLYNPGDRTAIATLDFRGRPGRVARPRSVQPVDFTGGPAGRAETVPGGVHRVTVRPRQIITLWFRGPR